MRDTRSYYNDPRFCSAAAEPEGDTSATVDKPRLCTILGVEVGEPVTVRYPSRLGGAEDISVGIDEDGVPCYETGSATAAMIIVYAINHPEAIIRAPRWDEDELALMRYLRKLGAAYITRDKDGCICAWGQEPWQGKSSVWCGSFNSQIMELEHPTEGLLPHLRPGEIVRLEEVVGT